MDEETQQKWLTQYEGLYSELIEFMRIVENTLRDFFLNAGHRIQPIQNRNGQPKSASSLQRKLSSLRVTKLEDIHDLVALRCLFYLDNELTRGLNDLHWNLKELHLEKIRYDAKRSDEGFNAHFVILRLAHSHSAYQRFKELKIEVQFTTVLEHSWNEIQHQTIYKQQEELSSYDAESFNNLKEKFGKVMSNHIKEALKNLEYLDTSAKKLIKARQIFQRQNLDEIDSTQDLNQLYFSIDALYDALSENGLKIPKDYDLLSLIERTIARSPSLAVQPFLVSGSEFEGKDSKDVIEKCLEIAKFCRYLDPIRLFKLLHSLWLRDVLIRDKVKEVLKNLCRFDLTVLRQVGYAVQHELVKYIQTVSTDELLTASDFYFEIFETLLDLRLEGVERTGMRTYSIPMGAPLPNQTLLKIRQDVVRLLICIFDNSTELPVRLRAIRTFGRAKDLPFTPNGDQESHREMAADGARLIFNFYAKIYSNCNLVLLKEVYNDLTEYKRTCVEELSDSDAKMLSLIQSNDEFGIFCAFVGYRSDFFKEGVNWRDAESKRDEKLDELVKSFDDPNSKLWQSRFASVVDASIALSVGECEGFLQFLRKLAVAKPQVISNLSDSDLCNFGRFNYEILIGLSNGGHVDELTKFTDRLFALNVGLDSIATALGFSEPLFQSSYKRLLKLQSSMPTEDLAQRLVHALATRKQWNAETIADCINLLKQVAIAHNRFSWIRVLGWNEIEFAKEVSESECGELLELLVHIPKIDHDENEILGIFIGKYPHLLIPFFEKRVLNPKDEQLSNYYALPSGSESQLRNAVRSQTDVILPAVLAWFASENYLVRHRAAYLFCDLFSLSDEMVQKTMLGLIDEGGEKLKIVLLVLQSLSGKAGSHEICKQIVIKHHKDEEVVRKVMSHLMHVETYCGDDGGLIQMQGFRDSVLVWDSTGNIKLQKFQKKFKNYADQLISAEAVSISKERSFENLEYEDYLIANKKVGNDSDD